MKLKNPTSTIAKLLTAVLLFGALRRQQYDYFSLLRWVVCGVSVFASYQALELSRNGWVWTFGIIAILFNPVFPAHFKRETWSLIDIGVAVILLISIATLDRHTPTS